MWRIDDPQGNESAKIKYEIVTYTRGRGLDLGCGPSKAYAHFIGVDNLASTRLFGTRMQPDVVVNDCLDLSLFATGSMDFCFSSHLLEHITDYKTALAEWMRVVKIGGHLVLYVPDEDEYPKVGEPGANPDHKWNVNYDRVFEAMPDGFNLVRFEKRNDGYEYSLFFVFEKIMDPVRYVSWKRSKPDKTACVCRFGGFGDMIQTSAILPELKRQGYHITVMTTPKGQDIIRHDPHIDDWLIQDNDQVPNGELGKYWTAQSKRFDKFINLSESVEGTFLVMPGRIAHQWPNDVRHKRLNKNYMEFMFELSGMPLSPCPKFYPTKDEEADAKDFIYECSKHADIEQPYMVMWALAGSSVHKMYPHQDSVIARILLDLPNAIVVMVGEMACKVLEQGWDKEPRVIRVSGDLTIRQTLALAQRMNCVVGPETGVLNAVSYETDVAKVVLLSHSSHENLTRDWPNTTAISAPPDDHVPICGNRPCHRLHYTRDWCPEDTDTGASMCAASISPHTVFNAIEAHYDPYRTQGLIQTGSGRSGRACALVR